MSNNGRVLTLKVEIKDSDAARWIWEAHQTPVNGIFVWTIADGDQMAELDKNLKKLNLAEERLALHGEYLDEESV